MTELRFGDNPLNWRAECLKSACTGYAKMWRNEVNEIGHINRPEFVTATKRRAMKLEGNSYWFKQKPKTGKNKPATTQNKRNPQKVIQPIESVLFIAYTPNSKLKKILTSIETQINGNRRTTKIRIVERAGPTVQDIIGNRSPWKSEKCTRQNCTPCSTKPGSCRKQNLVYKITCLKCQENNRKAMYIGESHRTWWDRSGEHLAALKYKRESNALVKHWILNHEGMQSPPQFKFEVITTCRSSLERQIKEAIAIQNIETDILMNSKGEWGST